ncbi:MAG: hypothetical protein M1829_002779 [Trizodia sp. TS-e1964]|nr:MAG: hypothetical protein M1829_002779 [Trizodia sp. TS-e1964]
MRYQNWDILLFPRGSKTPVQEFKTRCAVVQTSGLHTSGNPDQSAQVPLPTLTCFIPSLAAGFPFRISIHNWGETRSHLNDEALRRFDETVIHEARLYIDGQCVGSKLLYPKDCWPQIIEFSSGRSKEDLLRFPFFNNDLLNQTWWNVLAEQGRIKVVIGAIVTIVAYDEQSMPVQQVRNLVAFSFQHAPIEILEGAGVAWPNPGMWHRVVTPLSLGQPAKQPILDDHEAHAHSPRRVYNNPETIQQPIRNFRYANEGPPAFRGPIHNPFPSSYVSANAKGSVDPFVDSATIWQAREHGVQHDSDLSMPDYVSSRSSRKASGSHMSGLSERSLVPRPEASDRRFDELSRAFCPTKDDGLFAPVNTRASSAASAPKPSAAAEARNASYAKHSRGSSLVEHLRLGHESRGGSDGSVRSDKENTDPNRREFTETPRLYPSPSLHIRGRKEGEAEVSSTRSMSNRGSSENIPGPVEAKPPAPMVAGAAFVKSAGPIKERNVTEITLRENPTLAGILESDAVELEG